MVVWALFDSETCTVAKALPEHEVYSFGIGGGTEHIHLDLSDFEKAKKELDKYPKPDVIFASPPCEAWSPLSIGLCKKITDEPCFNLHWRKDMKTPCDFTNKYKATRINGVNTAITLVQIIWYYSPKLWAIENPRDSLIFKYIFFDLDFIGNKNVCNYYSYGFDVLKPTVIYSNYLLELKKEKPKGKMPKTIESKSSKYSIKRCDRSKVPPLLYRDIMRQFMLGGQPALFPLEETA